MTAQQLVVNLIEGGVDDDDFDAKGFIENRALPKQVVIVGRQWWRRGSGGMYFTANISVDGNYVGSTPINGGSGDQYLHAGWEWLEDNGYVPTRERHKNGGCTPPRLAAEALGIKLEYYSVDVRRERDL